MDFNRYPRDAVHSSISSARLVLIDARRVAMIRALAFDDAHHVYHHDTGHRRGRTHALPVRRIKISSFEPCSTCLWGNQRQRLLMGEADPFGNVCQ